MQYYSGRIVSMILQFMKNISFLVVLIFSLLIQSCKKNDTIKPDSATKLNLLRDSIYLYTKEVYLWHEVIPSYDIFNPRQYIGSTELEAAQNEMAAIRALQPQDSKHGYSFVTTQEESDAIQTGEDKDYGFFVKSFSVDKTLPNDSIFWFVEYVYKNSPAGSAGIQRGWYISKINSTNIDYSNASIGILNDVFFGSTTSATFTFTKPDGSAVDINLAKNGFTANSVLYSNVITSGVNKIGYVVFNQFFGDISKTELANVFNDFTSKGITDLIVDLRYNHGGSTSTQETFADLIAPFSANTQTMYTYIFNDSLTAGNFPLLRRKAGFTNVSFTPSINTVKYQKNGSLNLSRVFFIVTGETASASELLINNLRPYIDVKLIGDTTFGKPVGFFPISIFDYAIYPISFKTVNSVGTAEYYDGFAPDKVTSDGVNKNWGDLTEPSLAAALHYISTGTFNRPLNTEDQNRQMLAIQKQYQPLNRQLSDKKFTGMFIENSK